MVQALKATMFDAYAGAWHQDMVQIAGTCLASWLVGSYLAQWRYINQSGHARPAVDF